MTRNGAGPEFFEDPPLGLPVAAADGIAIHHRFVIGRRVDFAHGVFSQHKPGRLAKRHPARRERLAVPCN